MVHIKYNKGEVDNLPINIYQNIWVKAKINPKKYV